MFSQSCQTHTCPPAPTVGPGPAPGPGPVPSFAAVAPVHMCKFGMYVDTFVHIPPSSSSSPDVNTTSSSLLAPDSRESSSVGSGPREDLEAPRLGEPRKGEPSRPSPDEKVEGGLRFPGVSMGMGNVCGDGCVYVYLARYVKGCVYG
eukprot:1333310-Amorphochlora_amoeboformis.AAC.1